MSKIICDICGTSYPETAKQCPICGCVRPGDVQRVTNEVKTDGKVSTGYTYVKGGRFSKSNVKKRTKVGTTAKPAATPAIKKEKENEPQSSRGLVIAAIVLLLAIIGVVIYIALHFFGPISGSDKDGTTPSGTQGSQLNLSCRGITLDADMVILGKDDALLLNYKLQPEGTTDKISFTSENPEIATVSENGNIVAVSEGTTKIIIKCGEVVKECTVVCKFTTDPSVDPTTPPTTPSTPPETTEPTTPQGDIRLNRKDITLRWKGESWDLYSGSVAKNLVKFSSDNENVVTFIDGRVVAVGRSTEYVWVHAEYEGQKVSCKILCNFQESTGGVTGNGGVSEDGGDSGGNTTSATGKIVNVQNNVNVRSGPGTTYALAGELKLGAQVTVTERKIGTDGMEWGKVSEGWVRMDFIQLDTN